MQKSNYDCAEKFYKQQLAYSIKIKDSLSISGALNKIAEINYQIGEFDKAYSLYTEAIGFSAKGSLSEAKSLEGQAHILWRYGDNVDATKKIISSIAIYEMKSDTASMISASNILAGIYMSLGDLEDAEEIYLKMLDVAIGSNDSAHIASNYEYLGVVDFFKNEFENAIIMYKKALTLNLIIDNQLAAGINYGNIGEAYVKLRNYNKALENYTKAAEIQSKYNFNSGLIFVYYGTGEALSKLERFAQAEAYYQRSLDLMQEVGETREEQYVYRLMADNYAAQGNYEDAYSYYQLHTAKKDSLFSVEKAAQIEEVKSKFQLEKKEQENDYLQLENQLKAEQLESKEEIINRQYFTGGLLLILLLVSIYLSVKLYRNKNLLTDANKSKERLFGFIAHDLKGPVGNIKSLAFLLQQQYEKDQVEGEKKELLNYIQDSSEKAFSLLNNLLDWAVTQQEGFNFKPRKLELNTLADKITDLFDLQLKQKSITLHQNIPKELKVFADEEALMTVIRNLISNAIKFTKPKGTIHLTAYKDAGHVIFKIIDNGVGMTQHKIKELKDTTSYNSTTGTANEKGSGLGFKLINEFAHRMDAKITIRSEVGKGTEIEITLPAA